MASTYSSNLKLQLMGTGDNAGTWGDVTNVNLGTALEEAVAGTVDVAFSSADVTLTLTDANTAQPARNMRLNLTGTSGGARSLIVPAIEKMYVVNSGLADACTVKVTGQTGVAVPAGKSMLLFNNGTDVVNAITHLASLTLATDLALADGGTGASDASGARTSLGLVIGTDVQAYDADLTALGGLAVTDGNFIVGNGTTWVAETGATARTSLGLGSIATQASSAVAITGGTITGITDLALADGGTGASDASGARTSLGLGSIATQASSAVAITGGTITGITDLALADGGTGASDASGARTSLGLVIGTDVQAYDADLTALGGLAVTDGNFIVGNGTTWVAETGATARTSLGLGSIATQASSAVAITGGTITGITDLTVADGGTGSSTLAANNVLLGNGASALQVVAPGTSGNLLTSNGTTWASTTPAVQGFPATTVMLFGQTAAPTGWTKDTTNYNNSALRIVTGAVTTGGTVDFTTAFASQTPAGTVSVSGSAGSTTLTTPQIPSHLHNVAQFKVYAPGSGQTGATVDFGAASLSPRNTANTGGGGSHDHPLTISSSSFSGTAINLAVKYVDIIRATKD
jgi:hypothetical protein